MMLGCLALALACVFGFVVLAGSLLILEFEVDEQ